MTERKTGDEVVPEGERISITTHFREAWDKTPLASKIIMLGSLGFAALPWILKGIQVATDYLQNPAKP